LKREVERERYVERQKYKRERERERERKREREKEEEEGKMHFNHEKNPKNLKAHVCRQKAQFCMFS
jgi:hypothetical protein